MNDGYLEGEGRLPVCEKMCPTCPFRPGSKYANLANDLAKSALTQRSRVCHSTGRNAIGGDTGKLPLICRGAREVQLQAFHAMKFIEAATDEAWEKKCRELGI